MYTIKTFLNDFSAAHRLRHGYLGRCSNLHGHNYRVQVTLEAPELNAYGLVTDFGDVKERFNAWIDTHWDHAVILDASDVALKTFVDEDKQRAYVVPDSKNTSVEFLAEYLFQIFTDILQKEKNAWNPGVRLTNVEVWESAAASASYGQ